MKTVLQHQELRQQQQAISAMYVLYSALSRTHDILVDSTNDYRTESDVFEKIKSIQGKSKKEVQQMRKTDSFLDMLVDEFLTAPYKEDFDQCQKKVETLQKEINTAKKNLLELWNLLNPTKELLETLLAGLRDEYTKILKNPNDYPDWELKQIKSWCSLLNKLNKPNFSGFTEKQKLELLCGPILRFIPHPDGDLFNGQHVMSAKNIEKAVSQFGFTHQNLPALLCKKLNTLCIEPCFIKFFLVPTHDTHYRLRLRLSVFTDAIIAVQNWLVQQNQKEPFDTMSKIGLDKFIISVNNWCDKIYPECEYRLSKGDNIDILLPAIQQTLERDFGVLKDGRRSYYVWKELYYDILPAKKSVSDLNEEQNKVIFDNLVRKLPNNLFELLSPDGFGSNNFDKLKGDKYFINWVFIRQYLGDPNPDNETVYVILADLDLKDYVPYTYLCRRSASDTPEEVKQFTETVLAKYKLLKPSLQLLNFANKLEK